MDRFLLLQARQADSFGEYEKSDRIVAFLKQALANPRTVRTASVKKIRSVVDHGSYEMRKELVKILGHEIEIEAAYGKIDGGFIGDQRMAQKFVDEKGIEPEKAEPDHNVCSIGFCKKEEKWYGWSHRAYEGFGIGDHFKESYPGGDEKGRKIKSLDEAKEAAKAFARSVS